MSYGSIKDQGAANKRATTTVATWPKLAAVACLMGAAAYYGTVRQTSTTEIALRGEAFGHPSCQDLKRIEYHQGCADIGHALGSRAPQACAEYCQEDRDGKDPLGICAGNPCVWKSGRCQPDVNVCVCEEGTLDKQTGLCKKKCKCEFGTPAEGDVCPEDGMEFCTACEPCGPCPLTGTSWNCRTLPLCKIIS